MTTELERKFFETFEIEPIKVLHKDFENCPYNQEHLQKFCFECFMKPCIYFKTKYSQITDTQYLELICLITKELNFFSNYALTSNHLKEYILKEMILQKDNFIKTQIQAQFKGE